MLQVNKFDISFLKRQLILLKDYYIFIALVPSAESHSLTVGSNHKRQFPTSGDLNSLLALNCRQFYSFSPLAHKIKLPNGF